MKKGFTLIELLGVIIVLSVIALITVPMVLDVVDDAKKQANLDTSYSYLEAAKLYYYEAQFDETKMNDLDKLNNVYDKVSIKGTKPNSGELYITNNGVFALAIELDGSCYYKEFDGDIVIKEEGDCTLGYVGIDEVNPTLEISYEGTLGSNDWYKSSLWVHIEVKDAESGPSKIKWCTGTDCEPTDEVKSTKKSILFENSTETVICAIGYDKQGNASEKLCSKEIKVDVDTPTASITTTVNDENVQQLVLNAVTEEVKSGYSYQWYKDGTEISDAEIDKYIVSGTGTYKLRTTTGSGIVLEKEITINTYTPEVVDGKTQLTVMGTMENGSVCVLKGKYADYTKEIPYDVNTCTLDVANNLVKNGNLEYKSNAYYTNAESNYYSDNNELVIVPSFISVNNERYIAIDPNKTYEQTITIKASNTTAPYLSGIYEFDCHKKTIEYQHVNYVPGSTTTLAQDLKDGDTVVYLTDLSGFSVSSSTQYYELGLIFWNYKDCSGNNYGTEVYSQNVWWSLYSYDNVNKTNNTITLNEPWDKGTIEAGTPVSQSTAASTYNYGLINGTTLTSTYQTYTNNLNGISSQNFIRFRPGTAYVSPFVIPNYLNNPPFAETYIKEMTFKVVE